LNGLFRYTLSPLARNFNLCRSLVLFDYFSVGTLHSSFPGPTSPSGLFFPPAYDIGVYMQRLTTKRIPIQPFHPPPPWNLLYCKEVVLSAYVWVLRPGIRVGIGSGIVVGGMATLTPKLRCLWSCPFGFREVTAPAVAEVLVPNVGGSQWKGFRSPACVFFPAFFFFLLVLNASTFLPPLFRHMIYQSSNFPSMRIKFPPLTVLKPFTLAPSPKLLDVSVFSLSPPPLPFPKISFCPDVFPFFYLLAPTAGGLIVSDTFARFERPIFLAPQPPSR